MGLGKTRQAIVALRHAAPDGPYLVVSPASVKRNWAREIDLASPGARIQLIEGAKPSKVEADWVVVNYDILGKRAYRLGQTRTVNVTYMVGEGTADDFVHTVLRIKSALVSAVVEGEALAAGVGGNVLDELQRALHAISPHLADTPRLLRDASERFRTANPAGSGATRPAVDLDALKRALEGLLAVLSGGGSKRYQIASSSQPGVAYQIAADGTDVTCSCPGFEYRGQCRHARDIKAALASGKAVPVHYREVA